MALSTSPFSARRGPAGVGVEVLGIEPDRLVEVGDGLVRLLLAIRSGRGSGTRRRPSGSSRIAWLKSARALSNSCRDV